MRSRVGGQRRRRRARSAGQAADQQSGRAGIRRCGSARAAPSTVRLWRRFRRLQRRTVRRHAAGISLMHVDAQRARLPSAWRRGSRWRASCAGQCSARSRLARVEGGHRHAEAVGLAADVVDRDQPVVAVQRGVLDALGRHRRGVLLQAPRERAVALAQARPARPAAAGRAARWRRKSNTLASAGDAAAPRLADRPVDELAVLPARLVDDVGAVDRERTRPPRPAPGAAS